MKKREVVFFLFLVSLSVYGQQPEIFERDILLAEKTISYSEGFKRNTGVNDFTYHSFREDISQSMLTRCTDGNMSIQWETAPVPSKIEESHGFIWMASMDLTDEKCRFDMFIDGVKRFEIFSGPGPELLTRNIDGGKIDFHTVEIDHHGDAHGYMTLVAPVRWLSPGRPLEIKITGSASGSNTWIIVYKADDALSYLHNKAKYSMFLEASLTGNESGWNLLLQSPQCFTGREIEITAGEQRINGLLENNGNYAEANIRIDKLYRDEALIIKDDIGKIVDIRNLSISGKDVQILNKVVLINELRVNDGIYLEAHRVYRPKTGSSLLKLSRSGIEDGTIYLMNSSHQDIAWMDIPAKCVIERDTMLLDPIIKKASDTRSFGFDIEDALMLKEYIHRHPEKKSIVGDLLNEGKISCGSTFIQPYEEMYSGEALARQFYFGARWLKKEFDYNAEIYWNVDVPGRTLQMPQIMRKAGTKYMVFSRFEQGFYKWHSPDGSFIIAYSPGHYANAYLPLQRSFFETARFISENTLFWSAYFGKDAEPAIPLLSDWDMSPAVDYNDHIKSWKSISEIENEKGIIEELSLPDFRITTADVFFMNLSEEADRIPSIQGERPAMWLYIHGPSHYEALKASRDADILLTKAEKFSSALAVEKGSFEYYPAGELDAAWEAKIYPDHGWGGKGGDITDNLFLMKFSFARSEARRLLDKALFALSAEIRVNKEYGSPLVVYNSINEMRNDIAEIPLVFQLSEGNMVVLKDEHGKKVPSQLTDVQWYSDGSLQSAKLVFLASGIPPIGYKTFYYDLLNVDTKSVEKGNADTSLSNSAYDIILGPRGIEYLYDKELQEVIIDNDSFAGGEVITMRSIGNGAGEFSDIQQPEMEGFDFTGSCADSIMWEIIEDGDVFTRLKIRQHVRYAEIERQLTIYHVAKKLDLDISILNWEGKLYREFRMIIPLKQVDADIAYEVPYGVLRVGKDEISGSAGERYITECSSIHPRGIQNWISSNNDGFGLTMSSDVVVVDFTDPLAPNSGKSVLQAVLLASRKSCHELGNEYLQTGDHHYHFSLTSHEPGWEYGSSFGVGSNERLDVVKPYLRSSSASLPESMSFFSAVNENVIISTVKKAEDTNELVARMYEYHGTDTWLDFRIFKDIKSVCMTDLLEYPLSELKGISRNGFETKLGKYAVETYKLTLRGTE